MAIELTEQKPLYEIFYHILGALSKLDVFKNKWGSKPHGH